MQIVKNIWEAIKRFFMALFGKKKEDEPVGFAPLAKSAETPKGTTYLGKNIRIKGTISGDDDVQILGNLEGTFNLKSDLQVGQSAQIIGEIRARNILISGNTDGTIKADAKLHLDKTAKTRGQITTPRLSINEGAIFDGEIQMSGNSKVVPKTAPSSTPSPQDSLAKNKPE